MHELNIIFLPPNFISSDFITEVDLFVLILNLDVYNIYRVEIDNDASDNATVIRVNNNLETTVTIYFYFFRGGEL